jgi:flagellar protein FliS
MTKHCLEDMLAATPARMVVMLYDEAIGALRTSVMAISAGDIECRCNSVTAAMEIIGHLWLSLDPRNGGEVAENLGTLYGHMINRLPMVNLYDDAEIAEEVIELLQPLRDSWVELDARIADGTADLSIDPSVVAAAQTRPALGVWGD